MSTWTHVSGIVRVDDFRINGLKNTTKIESILGKQLIWKFSQEDYDLYIKNPRLFTPTGSEGGLEYRVYENPDTSSISAYCVSIFGDLRDFDSESEVEEWFDRIVNKSNLLVRDAILRVSIEGISDTVLLMGEDNKLTKINI